MVFDLRNLSKTILIPKPVKIVGGSTITQQLAKNLFLSQAFSSASMSTPSCSAKAPQRSLEFPFTLDLRYW